MRRERTATAMSCRWTAALAALGLALGCADAPERIRKFTYPPDFHYLTAEELSSTMGQLAGQVNALDAMMTRGDALDAEQREAVAALLREIDALAATLAKGRQTNHPRIHHNLPKLRNDVADALLALQWEPPSYFYAGRVSAACTYCHVPRHVRP